MSTKQTQIKIKISEAAKELGTDGQEISAVLQEKLGVAKKPSASMTEDEFNYILEHYSQNNQVTSFDDYYASRNDKPAVEEPVKEKKEPKEKKEAPKKEKKTEKAEKPAKTEKADKAEKPAAEEKKPAAAAEKPVEKAPEKEKKAEKKPQPSVEKVKTEQRSALERFNMQMQKSDEQKKKASEKVEKKPAQKNEKADKAVKTKLDGAFSASGTSKVEQKIRTVDTRGSYVDIDKYNERYDNMATASGG
ncbi:MAG: translation initiation factor IF-2 N-terminal domain-containing protein, partial [Oscillospiraceae bacterium]|nr:translation initiation factor IF-2 N-terminal domain-containing protein [Oscillospiraceae bacterium]